MFNTDPNRSVEEILADIQQGAVSTASQSQLNLVGSVLAPFSALLVRLGRDAEKTARKLLISTYILLLVTVILLLVTVVLVGIEVFKLSRGDNPPIRAAVLDSARSASTPPNQQTENGD